MDFDDDELNISADEPQEEFHEDNLTNEEYDHLYDSLELLRDQLADYNPDIDDKSLKEILYYNYFEVEPSLSEVKSTFKRSTYPFFHRFPSFALK